MSGNPCIDTGSPAARYSPTRRGTPKSGRSPVALAASFGTNDEGCVKRCMSDLDAPKRRLSRVSFASACETKDSTSPESDGGSPEKELPPSPCRGRRNSRSRYSFGARMSLGSAEGVADAADACEVVLGLPNTPPQSPRKLKEAWSALKQFEEELESKQRHLEEWDFELKEEQRQHRESRRILARKMSELEARELRAAKHEERRLSATSGTPSSSLKGLSVGATPPSSSMQKRVSLGSTPEHCIASPSEAGGDAAEIVPTVLTYDDSDEAGWPRSSRRLCRFGTLLQLVVKAVILFGVLVAPELSMQAVETVIPCARTLHETVQTFVYLGSDRDRAPERSNTIEARLSDSSYGAGSRAAAATPCEEALQDAQAALAEMRETQPQVLWSWPARVLLVVAAMVAHTAVQNFA